MFAALTDVIMSTDSQVLELHATALFTIGEGEVEFMQQFLKTSVQFLDKLAGTRKRLWKDVSADYLLSLDSPPDEFAC